MKKLANLPSAGLVILLAIFLQGCSSKGDRQKSYLEHFESVSGYEGPLTKFNFSYATPTEFETIGWVKVGKSELVIADRNVPDLPETRQAPERFYCFKSRVICPPENHRFINWSERYEGGRMWMSYDLDDEFLWFVDERGL